MINGTKTIPTIIYTLNTTLWEGKLSQVPAVGEEVRMKTPDTEWTVQKVSWSFPKDPRVSVKALVLVGDPR